MKKNLLYLLLLTGLGALLTVAACKKDDDKNTTPNNNNNNNNSNNNNNTAVDPAITPGAAGSVVFSYSGAQVTYATVRAKDGKIWLQQNLGAARVATSATDASAYGDLYQWGRWADGHQVRTPAPAVKSPSTLSANNPSGLPSGGSADYISGWWSSGVSSDKWTASAPGSVTATNGYDPCKALGTGWHMPSDAEWTAVVDEEGITNNSTAFSSNLKIPTGGWRLTNSASISSAGSSSWYWSSTATSAGVAKGVWIQAGSVQKSYGDTRAYGTSVRCVKD